MTVLVLTKFPLVIIMIILINPCHNGKLCYNGNICHNDSSCRDDIPSQFWS